LSLGVIVSADGGMKQAALIAASDVKLDNVKRGQDVRDFAAPLLKALDGVFVPLPGREVEPGESWKFEPTVAVDCLGKFQSLKLELTCTYQGLRKANKREEAVLSLEGEVKERELGGKAVGVVMVDVATGLVRHAELAIDTDLPAVEAKLIKREKLRVRSLVSLKLERVP